jgi:predicted MPP superfamily phosphohydrolase
LDALVISDLHYVDQADHVCPIEARRSDLGPALVHAALRNLDSAGVHVDLSIILGDVVDNGLARGAGEDLAIVAAAARQALSERVPVLAVPGNHDGDCERFAEIYACRPGLHAVGGYGFLVFHDLVGEGHVTTRPPEGLDLPAEAAAQRPDLPLIALQHNPLYLKGEHDYPFVLANAATVLDGYREAGVVLSLSGHYHPGRALRDLGGGISSYIVPAACEAPFRFAHLRLAGRAASVCEMALDQDSIRESAQSPRLGGGRLSRG